MSSHIHHEIFLHLVWRTHDSRPILTPDAKDRLYAHVRQRCAGIEGLFLHALGGTDDHVNLAINIEPKVSISEVMHSIKGASAHDLPEIRWQRGYGVVSFAARHLGWVVEYVENQVDRHAKRKLHEGLERCTGTG